MRFTGNGITNCYPDEVDNFVSITVLGVRRYQIQIFFVDAIGVLRYVSESIVRKRCGNALEYCDIATGRPLPGRLGCFGILLLEPEPVASKHRQRRLYTALEHLSVFPELFFRRIPVSIEELVEKLLDAHFALSMRPLVEGQEPENKRPILHALGKSLLVDALGEVWIVGQILDELVEPSSISPPHTTPLIARTACVSLWSWR